MTNTLTPEQIAQGWILNDGKGPDDDKAFVQVYAPADGCELGHAEDFDFSFPSADDHETDPIGSANNYFTMYRLLEPVRPSLPSPPVSGGVKLEWAGSDLFYNNRHIGSVSTWFWGVANSISGWKLTLCGAEIDKMAYEKGEQYGDLTTYKKARAALEASARKWLSPLINEPVWLGMTDAPRDGTAILGDVDGSAFVVWWDKMHSGWVSGHTDADDELYTRDVNGWMPLPIPQQEVQP